MARRRSKHLKGYTPLGGTSRRFRTPTGETISRRQYENLRLQKRNIRSWSAVQRASKSSRRPSNVLPVDYARWLQRSRDEHGKKGDAEFHRLIDKAADDDFEKTADGTFHDFLVYLGYRQPETDFPPGDS